MGFIYAGEPINVSPYSHRKLPFKCRCGKVADIHVSNITSGNTVSCNKCNDVHLNPGDKYMGFTYVGGPVDVGPYSYVGLDFKCRCGKTFNTPIQYITSKHTVTCNKCNNVELNPGDRYKGFTYVGEPISVGFKSSRKIPFRCRCGRVKSISVIYVTNGDTKTCGNCRKTVFDWYKENKGVLTDRSKFSVGEFPAGGISPLEDISSGRIPFRAICPACGSEYKPRLKDVRRGLSLTCGCCSSRISAGNVEISDFLKSLGVDAEFEFLLGGRSFDVHVPSRKVLIEFNGVRYHSMPGSRGRDLDKYKIATEYGYGFISIFEDEWKHKQSVMKDAIRNRLGLCCETTSKRPSDCEVLSVSTREVKDLYERFHYIGSCMSPYNYVAKCGDRMVCAMSFRRPSRQTIKQQYEISRMVSDPELRVHGIWSKLLKQFIREHSPKSIVSFSDNRLFTGKVYERMGFRYDGDVPPDYYWVKGSRRFHKSALRKRGEERASGQTEVQLREAQGYRKIWDLGKKRWTLDVP